VLNKTNMNASRLLNFLEIATPLGWRTIKLVEGDITNPDPSSKPDILVVSSFKGSYAPVESTVIGQLFKNHAVSVEDLAEAPVFQVGARDAWLSDKLDSSLPFGRIACVEMLKERHDSGALAQNVVRAIRSLFGLLAVAEINALEVRTVALPILGTGEQGLGIDVVLPLIVETVSKLLMNLSGVETVLLYVNREGERASSILNQCLKRSDEALLRLDRTDRRIALVGHKIQRILSFDRPRGRVAFVELADLLTRDDGSFVTVAGVSRRVVEALMFEALDAAGEDVSGELIQNIEALSKLKVAPWVLSYMHMLRIFGNEAVHEKPQDRRPNAVNQGDFGVLLICLDQVLEWWVGWLENADR